MTFQLLKYQQHDYKDQSFQLLLYFNIRSTSFFCFLRYNLILERYYIISQCKNSVDI